MFSCLARARRKLIRVMSISRGPAAASVSQAGGLQRETAEDVSQALETAGYPFALRRCTLSFGQPLASVEDAAAFVRVSAAESTGQTVRSFLRNHLVPGRSSQFPWELPKEKEAETTLEWPHVFAKLPFDHNIFLERFGANHCHAVYGDHVEELKMICRMLDIDVEMYG